jgi:RNA polymerase sigma-70 factor (ECF subfamily)
MERTFRFLPLETIGTLRDGSDPATLAQHRELLAQVEAALGELDPETALILTLRDLEGLSYRELEALLDLPSGTVKSRIHRGRRELLQRLELRQARSAAPDQAGAFFEVVPC